MSAVEILKKLDGLEIGSIEPLQRILLTTDGTLTEILEAAFLEDIQLIKVSQQLIPASLYTRFLSDSQEPILRRNILLHGATSHRNYVYAESLIAIHRLGPEFREQLVNSNIPLGRLWLEHKLETFKQIQHVRCQDANKLSHYFDCADGTRLLVRTYHVFSAAEPLIAITEYFPASYKSSAAAGL